MNFINLSCHNDLTNKQINAMARIVLNAGVSIRYPLESTPVGKFYIRLVEGCIAVGRMREDTEGEGLYMYPTKVDMETMDADNVGHIQLPLKEILAMGMEDLGAYRDMNQIKQTFDYVKLDQHGNVIGLMKNDPTDLNYLMKRLRFDNHGFVVGDKPADDGEIVSVEDVVEPKKDE